MDLKTQPVPASWCELKGRSLSAPPFLLVPPPSRKGVRHGLRCRAHEAHDTNATPPHYASWLETRPPADAYGGWPSAEEDQPRSDSPGGWLKIGGAVFLGIGIALGGHLLYHQTGFFDKPVISVPVKEQTDFSNLDHPHAAHDNVDSDNLSTNDEEGTKKQKSELAAGSSSSNIEQKDIAEVISESNYGKFLVPAPVDHVQEQTLAALQALKVIEADAEPDSLCSRREYARWLIAASDTLTRCPANRVLPAMYIENVTELAFDDVSPEDSDFSCIQGLAEAGLIPSKLTKQDMLDKFGNHMPMNEINQTFSPDSLLSRQDLVTWKLALERRWFPAVNKEELQEKFIDIDKVHPDTLPALVADASGGERSIVALAFGHTRRFQPDKPVTKAQAVMALSTGEASDIVSEELARLEAESIAEAAVARVSALENKAQMEVVMSFNHLLEEEKSKKVAADKLLESILSEMQSLREEKDKEKAAVLRELAAIDSERELFYKTQQEVEAKSESLVSAKLEVAFERERIETLRLETESEREILANLQEELEAERKAVVTARLWAEEEARKAYSHLKALEAARKRWEDYGIQVYVEKELDDSNIPALSWQYSKDIKEHKSAARGLQMRCQQLRWKAMEAFASLLHAIEMPVLNLKDKVDHLGFITKGRELGWKVMEISAKILHIIKIAASKLRHKAYSLKLRLLGWNIMEEIFKILQAIEIATNNFKCEAVQSLKKMQNTAARVKDSAMLIVARSTGNLQQILYSSGRSMSSSWKEATGMVLDRWKGGVQVHSEKELDDSNTAVLTWQYDNDVRSHKSSMSVLLTNFMHQIMGNFARILHTIQMVLGEVEKKTFQALQQLGNRAVEVKDTMASEVTKKAGNLRQIIHSSTSNLSSGLREGGRTVVDQCKEGAGMLAQKFKIA